MSKYSSQSDFRHETPPATGVLLANLGTPDAPTADAVRRYLAEFLWDPRVVELPRPLWWLILHGIILRIRPKRVAKAYRSIWTEHGSPLLHFSEAIASKIQQNINKQHPGPVHVELGMCYGNPSIPTALHRLREKNIQRLLVLPLYPQYSATTTGAVFDIVTRELQQWRWVPEIRMVMHYHDVSDYISAIAESIQDSFTAHGIPDKLLFSFHGLPERYLHAGDPYFCHCQKTARLVAETLDLDEKQWQVCFQSRFGREPWLQPYTDETLKQWAQQGIKHVQVISPGFAADCLETLEELIMQNQELFIQHGGEKFTYIPALNDSDAHVQCLLNLIESHTTGWPEIDKANVQHVNHALRLERARSLGAKK